MLTFGGENGIGGFGRIGRISRFGRAGWLGGAGGLGGSGWLGGFGVCPAGRRHASSPRKVGGMRAQEPKSLPGRRQDLTWFSPAPGCAPPPSSRCAPTRCITALLLRLRLSRRL